MLAGERESSLRRVVESRPQPVDGCVALRTIKRKSGCGMVRIIRALIILQMTVVAGGTERSVLAARVALLTCGRGVRASQRKPRGVVIEGRRRPVRGSVAKLAALRKSGGRVVRGVGSLVILQMAGNAIRADVGERTRRVALRTGDRGMRSGERECRQVMVKRRAQPGGRVVASGAVMRKSSRDVVRVGRLREIGKVTAGAIRCYSLETVPGVTRVAGERLMGAGQSKIREAAVIEARDLPAVRVMAGFAGGREAGGDVIQNAILLEIASVATDALRAEAHILAHGRAAVAGVARQVGMGPDQREAVPVILDRTGVDSPSLDGVAALALRAELALMKVRVAIGAARSSFGKDFGYVAGIAGDVLVHAAQLEAGFGIVIELDVRPQQRPIRRGMAVLARKRKFPVWVHCVDLRERRQRQP